MADTRITFLGTAAVLPSAGQDTASYLINGAVMIDCGWYGALNMLRYGCDPTRVEVLLFTHFHHDHYMGLPALLFYRAKAVPAGSTCAPLRIVGPADDLPKVLELSRRFLQEERFSRVIAPVEPVPLEPGSWFETPDFRWDTIPALHDVPAVSGRFTDRRSGVVLAFSGDTGPNPALVELARGADLLVHEASLPPDTPDEQMRGTHSRAVDAARIASAAGVKRLRLVHVHGGHHRASEEAARALFPETRLAAEGETLTLARG